MAFADCSISLSKLDRFHQMPDAFVADPGALRRRWQSGSIPCSVPGWQFGLFCRRVLWRPVWCQMDGAACDCLRMSWWAVKPSGPAVCGRSLTAIQIFALHAADSYAPVALEVVFRKCRHGRDVQPTHVRGGVRPCGGLRFWPRCDFHCHLSET